VAFLFIVELEAGEARTRAADRRPHPMTAATLTPYVVLSQSKGVRTGNERFRCLFIEPNENITIPRAIRKSTLRLGRGSGGLTSLILPYEFERRGVHAVAQSRRLGPIVEDVSQMGVAASAADLGPLVTQLMV
jgi:hypothetical protein